MHSHEKPKITDYEDAVRLIPANLPLSEEQKMRIKALVDDLKVPSHMMKQRLRDLYGVDRISDLRRLQAKDLLKRLIKSKAIKFAR